MIAYNLGNLWRRLYHPKNVEGWSFTSLQQRLVKTGGRQVKHSRYYRLLLAESVAVKTGGASLEAWYGKRSNYPVLDFASSLG